MKYATIRQALQNVADNPDMPSDDLVNMPVHELVCRTLFEIANNPLSGKRGAQSRANAARTLIFDRMVGKRQPGAHPAARKTSSIAFANLAGEVEQ